ncbi:MAG TPA: phosphatidylinositol-specific phospholipase C [Pseudonocardiaceae bacterium]|nr:phosphatidylinositol-specific phospholipase C [Pseudonocardiaceae bacterium]
MGDEIAKKTEELKGKAMEVTGKLVGSMQPWHGTDVAGQEDFTGEIISYSSWMSDLPGDVSVTAMSIPGTHDSACTEGPLGVAKTQNLDIPEQLNAGIRFIDIRLAHYQDNLLVHHDAVYMGKSYKDILKICSDFLVRHPSETILMLVQAEGRFDDSLGDFAPSEVLARLSRGEPESWDDTRSFEDEFEDQTWEQVGSAPLFYNFAACPPGDRAVAAAPEFTAETKLGDVRGKIVLLRRFPSDRGIGFDVTYWLDDTTTRSNEDENGNPRDTDHPLVYDIEDHYSSPDDKYGAIVTHIEKARSGDLKDLYITFSSAVTLQASGYSQEINPLLNDYLTESTEGRIGIVAMDYFDEPRELASNVIKMNSRSKIG